MTFDEYGYLTPYEITEIDLETFEQTFVKAFSELSRRSRLFENYLAYTNDLQNVIGTEFIQWIDGSFTTQKFNPNDIDFITFLDFEIYERFDKEIVDFKQRRYARSVGTDGYFIKIYPQEHRLYYLYEIEKKRWLFDFATDYKTHQSKGIIQLQRYSN
jgi:hypothetical protein